LNEVAIEDLATRKLREGVKVLITGMQHERMLQDQSRDPHIIRRDLGLP
jgi:hypothetical protein